MPEYADSILNCSLSFSFFSPTFRMHVPQQNVRCAPAIAARACASAAAAACRRASGLTVSSEVTVC